MNTELSDIHPLMNSESPTTHGIGVSHSDLLVDLFTASAELRFHIKSLNMARVENNQSWHRHTEVLRRVEMAINLTNTMDYDSKQDTTEHILRVRELLYIVQNKLEARGFAHDQSKLGPNEKPVFDTVTTKLKGLTYGSDEYKACLKDLGPALQHHYANNSHHPEHFANGVNGMSLLDVIEMLVDWKAAGERHADGSITRSLTVNRDRFKIGDQLHVILENTVRELGWCT